MVEPLCFAECFLIDKCDAVGVAYVCQCRAFEEGSVADALDVRAQVDALKTAAVLEYVVFYFVYGLRENHAFEACAGVECVRLDGCHAVGDNYVCHFLALEECSFADACHVVGLVTVADGRGDYNAVCVCPFG